MSKKTDYQHKIAAFSQQKSFTRLSNGQQRFIRDIAFAHRMSFQEIRQVAEAMRDLQMWGETELPVWWQERQRSSSLTGQPLKKQLLQALRSHLLSLKRTPKSYPANGLPKPQQRHQRNMVALESDKNIHGMCPVASDDTVCCNLRTIDAVENCAFGCSYCTIQTFYKDTFTFDRDFAKKLAAMQLDPGRFYHFGTGQSSDSLVWGNRHGVLDALCDFAVHNPNVLLEFKTKSDNINFLLKNDIPANIVCSWSLNTRTIIDNEEHFTASYERRLQAARQVADRNIRVAFHFHPMVYYDGWPAEYEDLAADVIKTFAPHEVLFISFGSVTMIKPAIQKIRDLGNPTKILQMEMIPDPHGKLTYPDEIKIKMFQSMHHAFRSWQESVFIYLCMEKASIWERALGYVYAANDIFEREFGKATMNKLPDK